MVQGLKWFRWFRGSNGSYGSRVQIVHGLKWFKLPMVQQLKCANGSSASRFPVLQGLKWFEDSNGLGVQMVQWFKRVKGSNSSRT